MFFYIIIFLIAGICLFELFLMTKLYLRNRRQSNIIKWYSKELTRATLKFTKRPTVKSLRLKSKKSFGRI